MASGQIWTPETFAQWTLRSHQSQQHQVAQPLVVDVSCQVNGKVLSSSEQSGLGKQDDKRLTQKPSNLRQCENRSDILANTEGRSIVDRGDTTLGERLVLE